jgi:hypothetical protein
LDDEAAEHEDVPDDVIERYLALLEEYRGRQVADASVLPASPARLRATLERRYRRRPDPAVAEALIALPVFVPHDDVDAIERFLRRRAGDGGPIGTAAWDRGLELVRRIEDEQRLAMRETLGSSGSGATSPIPVRGGVADAKAAAVAGASYDASLAWTVAAYGATGLGTLVVLGVGASLLGEPVGAVLLIQGVLLVIGFLPALGVMHVVLETLARRAAEAGRPPESTDTASVVMPVVAPIVIALISWLLVTSP